MTSAVRSTKLYHLGCPAWSISEWRGTFLHAGTRTAEFLGEYSKTFNTVEGNSFFYALPKINVVERWVSQAAEGFEFCFKVPRDLSHFGTLKSEGAVYDRLIQCLDCVIQAGKLGPTFLQLHASFSPERLDELESFCKRWPDRFPLAVEVRHLDFFTDDTSAHRLNQFLESHGVDRVIFDSRGLFHAPPGDPAEEISQGRKPNLPVRWETTGQRPMIRFVGRNEIVSVLRWQREVAERVAFWINEGKHPYVFMHTPCDTLAPYLCRQFHELLQNHISELPDIVFPQKQEQIELF